MKSSTKKISFYWCHSIIWCFLLSSCCVELKGQSDHYWSQNFNTQSSIVAGAVVGGAAGPSAIYYNPALIDEEHANRLSLSANLVSIQFNYLYNHAGLGTDDNSVSFHIQPKFISYTGTSKKNEKINFEVAFLTPIKWDRAVNYYYQNQYDVIKRLDGLETYTGEINYRDAYTDLYIGGGLSWGINDHFSIGFSGFASIKLLDYSVFLQKEASQNTDTTYSNGYPEPVYIAQNSINEQVKYWDISLVFKAGFHYRTLDERLGLGLKISLPNIHIYGEGKIKKKFIRSNVFDDLTGSFTTNLKFIGYQEHVLTNIKDPFSIAVGGMFLTKKKKDAFVMTMEYFFPIDTYSLFKTRNGEVTGNLDVIDVPLAMTYVSSAKDVFNIAVGYVRKISESFTVSVGFKTDFNNHSLIDRGTERNEFLQPILNSFYVNKYHFIVGPSFTIKSFGIITGVQYSWGREDGLKSIADFIDPIEYDPVTRQSLQGVRSYNMTIKYNEISLFFGLTYAFGKE